MSTLPQNPDVESAKGKQHPFRRAILRGLGIVLPPLLTIVVFLWAWTMIESYVLAPIETLAHRVIVWSIADVKEGIPRDVDAVDIAVVRDGQRIALQELFSDVPANEVLLDRVEARGGRVTSFLHDGRVYVPIGNDEWIPQGVYEAVKRSPGGVLVSTAPAREIYSRYVWIEYLQRSRVIPVFLVVFIGILYLLGKFLAAGVGRILWTSVEGLIHRLPIIRNVYSSVKQVTDFVFSEREIEFNRVVAVEYPRKGIWSVGFVTGESMLDIRSAANEAVLSVLMPTSPMPATGFTITVLKSETIDLNLSIDQAIQFIVSCGVVTPAHQQYPSAEQQALQSKVAAAIANHQQGNGDPTERREPKAASPDETEHPS